MIQVFNTENNHVTNKNFSIIGLQTKFYDKIVYKREN